MGETRTGRDRCILCGTAERHRPGTVLRLLRGERLAYGTEPYAQLESGSAYLGTKKGRQFRRKHAGTSAADKACRPGNTVLGLCVLYLQSLLSCGNGCGKWRRVPTVGNDSSVSLTAVSSSKRITPQSPTVTAQHKAHPTGALKGSLYMPPLIEEVPDRAEESFRETYQRANNVRPYRMVLRIHSGVWKMTPQSALRLPALLKG